MKKNKVVIEKISNDNSEQIFENSIWMTAKGAAKYLSRTENAIRILICRKVLRPYHLGTDRVTYLKRSEIDALIESSIIEGGY